jgi:hypothetical protein
MLLLVQDSTTFELFTLDTPVIMPVG